MRPTKLLTIIALSAILFSCAQKPNTLTEKEKSEGWQLLFDGEALTGWKNYNSDTIEGWFVEGDCLTASGTGADHTGYIVTEKEYDNFELAFEWKIANEGNSGLMYHVIESEKYKTPYLTGPEYQLLDDVGFPQKVEDWQETGADYAMHVANPEKKKLMPVGNWNTSRIVFDNGHVQHWLNGELVVEFDAWTEEWFKLKNSGKWSMAPEYGLSETGHIALQDHGSRVWFKNMKIKELQKKEKPSEKLFNGKDLSGWIEYGEENWYVEDNLLICESGEQKGYGYLATEKYYKDFDLSVDFKQISNGNSGIFFRSTVDGTKVSGWQVEVAPQGNDSGGIYESYGRGWLHKIPEEKESAIIPSHWNTMRIKVIGNSITTWLNGTLMTELNDHKIGKGNGRIALQIHDGGGIKVAWKNLTIQPL